MTIATQAPGRQWIVASETRANVLYIVRRVNGQFSCDCPGNVLCGHCKHVTAIAASQPRAFKVDPALGLSLILTQPK